MGAKDNPNKEYLNVRKMNADPKSKEIIQERCKTIQWIIRRRCIGNRMSLSIQTV